MVQHIIYLDYRDQYYTQGVYGWDIKIEYNADTQAFRWACINAQPWQLELDCCNGNWSIPIESGSTLRIWEMRCSPFQPLTSSFQPTDPSNLSIVAVNKHPHLTWTCSSDPSDAKYNIYRSANQSSGFVKITSSAISNNYYDDIEINLEYSPKLYYKVQAVSSDGSKSSVNYTNTFLTPSSDPTNLSITAVNYHPHLIWTRKRRIY